MTEKAISLPFRFVNGGVAAAMTKPEIWKDRVFVALTTGTNERAMAPTYGTEIIASVFETADVAEEVIRKAVGYAFSTWLPALTLNTVTVEPDSEYGYLNISVDYTLPNSQRETLTFKTDTFNRYGEIVRGDV